MNQAHLAVEETVFEALAACYASVLPEDRREAWPCWISARNPPNWWSTTATPCNWPSSLPISGDHFTRDVARGLCISFEDAVSLKQEFGCARADVPRKTAFVEVASRDDRDVPRRTLNRILEARAEELFRDGRRESWRAWHGAR